MSRARSALGLLAAVLLLPACTIPGDYSDADPTTRPSETPSAVVGLGNRASMAPVGTTTREITATFQFTTPSKNIGCFVAADGARCDIAKKSWKPPARPADCDLDWGNGVAVDAEQGATVVCAGDTVLSGGEVLPYGEAVRVGTFVCESQNTGVRCRNDEGGHGFTLSRDQYTFF